MMQASIFSQNVVMIDQTGPACLHIVEGLIEAVEHVESAPKDALDCGTDLLIPGLVDIHTDNLEKHYQPRPGALWDSMGAALAHDAQCAAAGITTVFDSLSLHGRKDGLDRKDALAPMIAGVDSAAQQGLLRSDHWLHLRCEITNPELLALLEPHLDNPRLRLLSVMDHTPGQRQTGNLDQFRARMIASGKSDVELEELLAARTEWRDQDIAPTNRSTVVALAREFGIPLMSHDDATIEHVDESYRDGCIAAEFPVSLTAAKKARDLGLLTVMGAPNFVRGSSHSGNLSARDCASADLLDVLSSDYVPLSMLRAAFQLMNAPFHWSAQAALATVCKNPARLAGLTDRGEIAVGQRADLVRIVRSSEGWPIPKAVWRQGVRVA
jgi:alpha-D-ribose 1-methylphosphonate 5-triphosphate diphosphatase